MKQSFESDTIESQAGSEGFLATLDKKEDEMKTTLALLITTLVFLTIPLSASAHGKQHAEGSRHYRSWNKDHHNHRYDRPVKKHLSRELRVTRQELRHVKRQVRHDSRYRSYYPKAGVVIGIPHIVFRFDL